jgi:hypothetical protein
MAKADRFKEEIGWLKVLTCACAGLAASLAPWFAQNYETARVALTIAAIVNFIAMMLIVVASIIRLYRRFEILEHT